MTREEVGRATSNLHDAQQFPTRRSNPPLILPNSFSSLQRLSSQPILTMMSARVARSGLRAAQQFSIARPAFNGLRTYATPAQDVRPPVALFGVDGTYATALVCIRPFATLFDGDVEVFVEPVLPRPLPLALG